MESTAAPHAQPPSEAALRLFIESVKDYAIFMLDTTGRIVSWNVGAERLKGYAAHEIIGSHFSRFYPESDIRAGKPEHELAVAAVEGRVEDEGWRIRKDGTRFWANVVITAVRNENGVLIGYGKVTRDLTHVREREAENALLAAQVEAHAHELEDLVAARTAALESANRELRHANEALETFAQTLAHDLRGPLRSVQGLAEILLDEHAAGLNDEGRDYLQRIARAARRLSELVQNLLAYSRVARSERIAAERVSLDRLVERVTRELQHELSRSAATVAVRAPLGEVIGHRDMLTMVVQNLVTNAVKFVAPGVHPSVEIWSERRDGCVRLNVQDNGIGLSPADQQRIFRPFERLHPSAVYAGTGLGLAIVAQAISRLGGEYGVKSDGLSGSCFWIELPAAPGREE